MNTSSQGKNGFKLDFVSDDFQPELYKLPDEHEGKGNIPLNFDSELKEAFKRHHKAMYILTQKDRPMPSLEEMEKDLEEPDDVSYWKKQVETAQEEHEEDMERLYAYHREEWYQDHADGYDSFSPEFQLEDNVVEEMKMDVDGEENKEIEKSVATRSLSKTFAHICSDEFSAYTQHYMQFADDMESIRHSHLTRLLTLQARQKKLAEEEEKARKERLAQFPQTLEEFYGKDREAQLRVARFLRLDGDGAAGKSKQEKMMSEFGWAWRQVEPLLDAYRSDAEFNADVMAKLIEISTNDPWKAKV